jgi:hypothetical protein
MNLVAWDEELGSSWLNWVQFLVLWALLYIYVVNESLGWVIESSVGRVAMMSVLLSNLHELSYERLDIRSLLIDETESSWESTSHDSVRNYWSYYPIVVATRQHKKRGRRGFLVIKAEVSGLELSVQQVESSTISTMPNNNTVVIHVTLVLPIYVTYPRRKNGSKRRY